MRSFFAQTTKSFFASFFEKRKSPPGFPRAGVIGGVDGGFQRVALLAPMRIIFLLLILLAPVLAWAQAGLTADQMCAVILDDIRQYQAAGRPCACPYSQLRSGRACGEWSAWSQPAGAATRCYFEDVRGEIAPVRRGQPPRRSWPAPPPCEKPMS